MVGGAVNLEHAMFEQLVRPFQSRQIGTTRRIVPVKVDDTPDEAMIAWGAVGDLPQGAVQPKGVNLENIENVGFNIRGSIDKFHQSPNREESEREEVDLPIKDGAGNTVGTATISRAKSLTWDTKVKDPNFGPTANFGKDANWTYKPPDYRAGDPPKQYNVTPSAQPTAITPVGSGIRANVPSADVSRRTDTYIYP